MSIIYTTIDYWPVIWMFAIIIAVVVAKHCMRRGVSRLLCEATRSELKEEGLIIINMAVLCVGLVCLDIVNYCERYPQEDEDIRATDQKWRKGGNAANTLSVLRLLDREKCDLLSTLGAGMETESV